MFQLPKFSLTLLFISYCHLLIAFTNSLDQDLDRQNVGPDLDPFFLNTRMVLLKEFFEIILKKKSLDKKHEKFPSGHLELSVYLDLHFSMHNMICIFGIAVIFKLFIWGGILLNIRLEI